MRLDIDRQLIYNIYTQQFSRKIISLSRNNETWAQEYELWSRNPLDIIQSLFSNPSFKEEMIYRPEKRFYSDGTRLYSEMHCSDWWWRTQVCFSPS